MNKLFKCFLPVFVFTACLLPNAPAATVTGYNGTQTFVTAAGKDPAEPNACGVVGGSSYWFTYQPPTNGLVYFNTSGSTYNTVLGIYVDNGQNLGYASLVSIDCDDDYGTNKWSYVSWYASAKTNYFIMLDGASGATGTAYLNYGLDAVPSISTIAAVTIKEDTNTAALAFKIGDRESAATSLTLSGVSSNLTLLASTNIIFGGSGSNRTVTLKPYKYKFGTSLVTIGVTDPSGNTKTTNFLLTVSFVNHPPVAVTDTVTRQPGKNITIARSFLARSDTDVDNQALTVTAVAATSKNGVAISLNSTNLIYAASSSTNVDQFTYTVSDGSLTATGTNIVNVSASGVLVVY
jgi:hypothetical protein